MTDREPMLFGYQMQKFSAARRALILPPPGKDAEMIALAFAEINEGLAEFDYEWIGDVEVLQWLTDLLTLMSTEGVADPNGLGLELVRAKALMVPERAELARLVDRLASFFELECLGRP